MDSTMVGVIEDEPRWISWCAVALMAACLIAMPFYVASCNAEGAARCKRTKAAGVATWAGRGYVDIGGNRYRLVDADGLAPHGYSDSLPIAGSVGRICENRHWHHKGR